MTTLYDYLLTVRSESPVPQDVLVEHVAVALQDFKEVKMTVLPTVQTTMTASKKPHPFDGPEVFDDVETEQDILAMDPYPTVTRALSAIAARKAQMREGD